MNFINANWIRISGSFEPDLFYSDKFRLVEKGNLVLAQSIYISVKNHYGSQGNYQLSKMYKSVTAFSLSNAGFPTLTPLSLGKPACDCINVLRYKSIYNSFIKSI